MSHLSTVQKHTQNYLIPWHTVCVDMMGPWTIPNPSKKRTKAFTKTTSPLPIKDIMIFSIIDPSTNFIELQVVASKHSNLIACTFDRLWLCHYPRSVKSICDSGSEFTGFEFQEIFYSYGIKGSCITVNNPQANSILERAHKTIGNQRRTLKIHELSLQKLDDVQSSLLDPVKCDKSQKKTIWLLTQNCYQRSHKRNKRTSVARDKGNCNTIQELQVT
jgi:hypothetical protein